MCFVAHFFGGFSQKIFGLLKMYKTILSKSNVKLPMENVSTILVQLDNKTIPPKRYESKILYKWNMLIYDST